MFAILSSIMSKIKIVKTSQLGFSIIELMVVIIILGILFTFVANNLNGTRDMARDSERQADVSTIARKIEDWYSGPGQGSYPSTNEIDGNEAWVRANLQGIDPEALYAPGTSTYSLIKALNAAKGINDIVPAPMINEYVYQPLKAGGGLCTDIADKCRSFTLFYRTEVDNQILKRVSLGQ